MFQPVREGKCIFCKAELSETTLLFVTEKGVVNAYCGGPCAQDFAVLSWIEEQHGDIIDHMHFRGGRGEDVET